MKTIAKIKQLSGQRVDITLVDGTEVAIIFDKGGSARLYSDKPGCVGTDFIDGIGTVVKVDYFGHPYED